VGTTENFGEVGGHMIYISWIKAGLHFSRFNFGVSSVFSKIANDDLADVKNKVSGEKSA